MGDVSFPKREPINPEPSARGDERVGGKTLGEPRNATGPDPSRSWVPRGAERGEPNGNTNHEHHAYRSRAPWAEYRPAGAAVVRDARADARQVKKYRAMFFRDSGIDGPRVPWAARP